MTQPTETYKGEMKKVMGFGTVDIGLYGTIQFQQTNDTIECFVHDVTENLGEAMVIASNSRICARENVELRMSLPAERSPIKCIGKIIWHSENEELFKDRKGYLARIFITQISRIDRRRLELAIAQKRAFISSGYGLRSAS